MHSCLILAGYAEDGKKMFMTYVIEKASSKIKNTGQFSILFTPDKVKLSNTKPAS